MKSQQPESSIKTNCKECAFAIYDGKTQTSCEFDRIKKFDTKAIPAYDDDKEFYVIDSLCSYYRNTAKGYTANDKNKVIEQSALTFDLLIDCNHISKTQESNLIDFLSKYSYYPNKTKILLFHEHGNKGSVKNSVEVIARLYSNINISVCMDTNEFLNDYILKTKNLCHAIINSPEKISKDIFVKINNLVNIDLGKFLVVEHGGNLFINNIAYKLINLKTGINDYYANVESIKEESKKSNLYVEI